MQDSSKGLFIRWISKQKHGENLEEISSPKILHERLQVMLTIAPFERLHDNE